MPQILLYSEVVLIMAWRCLIFLAPFGVMGALWWLALRTDLIIDRLFPHLEWERNLGWFNIKATRRAETALIWVGHFIKLVLAVALLGIVWGARDLALLFDPPTAWPVGELMVRLPVLAACLGAWIFYLGYALVPKLREERELRDLNRYRASLKADEWMEHKPNSRVQHPLQKPRFEVTLTPSRPKRRL